jgi:DNA helicase IV
VRDSLDSKKEAFIREACARLKKIYSYGAAKVTKKEDLRNELHGFFQAGILLKVITTQEIDKEHMTAFGKTKKQRNIDEKIESNSETNWDKYDEPAYQRR